MFLYLLCTLLSQFTITFSSITYREEWFHDGENMVLHQIPITLNPTLNPTNSPSNHPTLSPTHSPTDYPSLAPTNKPTHSPSNHPSLAPTNKPTNHPTPHPIIDTAPKELSTSKSARSKKQKSRRNHEASKNQTDDDLLNTVSEQQQLLKINKSDIIKLYKVEPSEDLIFEKFQHGMIELNQCDLFIGQRIKLKHMKVKDYDDPLVNTLDQLMVYFVGLCEDKIDHKAINYWLAKTIHCLTTHNRCNTTNIQSKYTKKQLKQFDMIDDPANPVFRKILHGLIHRFGPIQTANSYFLKFMEYFVEKYFAMKQLNTLILPTWKIDYNLLEIIFYYLQISIQEMVSIIVKQTMNIVTKSEYGKSIKIADEFISELPEFERKTNIFLQNDLPLYMTMVTTWHSQKYSSEALEEVEQLKRKCLYYYCYLSEFSAMLRIGNIIYEWQQINHGEICIFAANFAIEADRIDTLLEALGYNISAVERWEVEHKHGRRINAKRNKMSDFEFKRLELLPFKSENVLLFEMSESDMELQKKLIENTNNDLLILSNGLTRMEANISMSQKQNKCKYLYTPVHLCFLKGKALIDTLAIAYSNVSLLDSQNGIIMFVKHLSYAVQALKLIDVSAFSQIWKQLWGRYKTTQKKEHKLFWEIIGQYYRNADSLRTELIQIPSVNINMLDIMIDFVAFYMQILTDLMIGELLQIVEKTAFGESAKMPISLRNETYRIVSNATQWQCKDCSWDNIIYDIKWVHVQKQKLQHCKTAEILFASYQQFCDGLSNFNAYLRIGSIIYDWKYSNGYIGGTICVPVKSIYPFNEIRSLLFNIGYKNSSISKVE